MRYRFLRFPGGKAKAVTFSYDDGFKSDKRLAETLSEYGLKCTFNLNNFNTDDKLSDDDVKKYILGNGHEIAVHGKMHRAEGAMRKIEGITDILDCRRELENKYSLIIRGMAYPDFGIRKFTANVTYEDVKNYLKELDIAYSRTLGGDNNRFEMPTDWYAWMPTAHHDNPCIMDYIDEFISIDIGVPNYLISYLEPRLFYIWGHSYEFERKNNWKHLDDICQKISGKEDIWYATNIEIYNYVQAYHSLIYSADSLTIYNPTLYTVYFVADGKLYSVNPGEQIKINED
ncbi:MAG: polysaccharide deacetylase family protein [Clostridia bacterium]|nr:polysaccharide deacetylase family protein [Clostridia bacterium]